VKLILTDPVNITFNYSAIFLCLLEKYINISHYKRDNRTPENRRFLRTGGRCMASEGASDTLEYARVSMLLQN
jgi:hypothetical protein